MRGLFQKLSYRSLLNIGPYEKDPGFRELLRLIAQQGLFIYGLLGTAIVIIYVSAHIFIGGKTIAWGFTALNPQADILLLDKSLILVFCLAMIPLSWTNISLNWIRRLIFILIWFICLAMLIDDIVTQDVSFTTAYTTIALLIAVSTVPYTGWQTALLTTSVIFSTILVISHVPGFIGMPPLELKLGQIIFISVFAILLTGISSQIYINRYNQYRARKRAEELSQQLEERANLLQKLKDKSEKQATKILKNEKLKDHFFANISHELRTPLTLILGPLNDLLRNTNVTDENKVKTSMLRLMQENGQRLLQLINQLLDLAKIDAGSIDLNLQPANLGILVEETVLSFSPMAENRDIDLSCILNHEFLVARIDSLQMERVISNLLSNALKFTPKRGKINVCVSRTDSSPAHIQIRITDTGVGIPEDELTHVFDRFYQTTHTSNTLREGTGIGLALVKEIVELHGGTVHVTSEPGFGSEFTVNIEGVAKEIIPATETVSSVHKLKVRERDEPGILAVGENNIARKDKPRVLLIDDNPDILTYLSPHLSKQYNVLAKESSIEALELIREKHIDLVISDVMMPDPDGFELCKIIKENPELNHIPIILLTARTSTESRIEGLELGADDYISKPFSASELMVRAENLIELRRMLRDRFSQEVYLKGGKIDVTSEDARFLKSVQSAIDIHMENSNFGVDWLADEVNLSTRQLQRKVRAITELSAGGYIRMMRLERASQLLSQKWGNISEISYKVGFQDAKYFSRLFKQTFGVNPTEFAEKKEK